MAGKNIEMTDKTSVACKTRYLICRLLSYAVAGVLLYSSLTHIDNPYVFLDTVYRYKLTGMQAGMYVAAVVPFIQLVLTFSLLLGIWQRESFLLATALFTVFVIVQTVAYYQGLQIPCGCFGAVGEPISSQSLFFTGLCTIASATGWFFSSGEKNESAISSC